MKLSWKDTINTLLAIGGGTIVYAKFYSYTWAVITSWRSAVAVLAVTGLLMFAFSSFNFANRSMLNVSEMVLGVVAIGLAIVGVIVTSQFVFYSLAIVLGVEWLVDTARHARHSWIGDEGYGTTTFHHHAHVH
jgi:hypothetical protein